MEKIITVEAIANKVFTKAAKGYDPTEVDDLLDAICDQLDEYDKVIADLQKQNQELRTTRPAAPAPVTAPQSVAPQSAAPAADASIADVLALAVKLKNDTLAGAKAEAELIVARAEAEAADRIGGLEEEKAQLEHQIASLRQTAKDYRARFEALLSAQQDALEKAADLF